jgi:tetratricopeptide (TPR) repeat protein
MKALDGSRGRYRLTQPLQALQVPSTVQTILVARIDRLSPEDKRLLQTASVVGKDVPFTLLQAIAGLPEQALRGGLDRLQAAEFLYEIGLFPDLEYTFKHALTHEVTYGSLLQERRRMLHAQLVDAVERLHPDRLAEQIERLAHHALRGELWEKAIVYLRQAGLRAMARGANNEAMAQLELALGALRHIPETRETTELTIDIRLDLRNANLPLGDRTRMGEHLHEAEMLARALGDRRRLARIATFMVIQCLGTGDYDEAVRFGREALGIAQTLGDCPIEVVATSFLGMTHAVRGELSEAAVLLARNAALEGDLRYERFGAPAIQSALSAAMLADVLSELGRFEEAIGYGEAAVRIAETADHPFTLFWGLFELGLACFRRGDLPRATRLLEQCLDLCRTGQILAALSPVAATLGVTYAFAGRLDEAVSLVAGAVEAFHSRQTYRWATPILTWAASTYLRAGRLEEAAAHAAEALAVARRLGGRGGEAHTLALAGDIAAATNEQNADGLYHEALTLAQELGMRPLVAHCHAGLAKFYLRSGQRQEAEEHLTTATTMYREMGMTYWLEQAEAETRDLA